MIKQLKKVLLLFSAAALLLSCGGNEEQSAIQATDSDGIKGHRVGVLAGSLCDIQFEDYAGGSEKQIYNGEPELLAAIDNGRVDFIVMDSIFIVGVDKEMHPIEISYVEHKIGGDVGVAFNKKDAELCRQFNLFLAQIRADGTYDQMLDRWISDKVHTSQMPEIENYTEGEPLKVGTILGLPCAFVKNGDWAGFEVEMMKRFGAYLHRPVNVQAYEFASLMAALKTGIIDVWCSFITITEERQKEVLFSDSYFHCDVALFQKTAEVSKSTAPFYVNICRSFHKNLIEENRWKMLVDGVWETLVISIFSLLFGTILGGVICLLRMSRRKILSGFAKVYIEILRGVPMLVLLMVMFYIVLASTGVSGRWVAIISFSINFSAYVSEIFRTGIEAIDKGQTEAGLAMGFTKVGTFFYFIIPQALKNILPVFKNEAVSLVKGTSIVGYVAIQDLTKVSDIIRSRTFDAFFPLIIISIIYFILAWLFGKGLDCISKKLS